MATVRAPRSSASARNSAPVVVEEVDTSFLETLLGYNARRAALAAITVFLEEMAPFRLKPVEFSVLSVIAHNPGVTSRQLCSALGILPPNLVGLVNELEKREVIARKPHPRDGRAMGLHLTPAGQKLVRDAEKKAAELEANIGARLSPSELRTLITLLKKIYRPG
ncbi:MAG: transcriptional regulator, MarR family-like protein [Ramlibacter sp.]|jgi:DNA-binding MarR family transcriptional regulator|nr:transcriptional regulator, MarR family-like protein [Ramlibacter sp.]MCE3273930.1 transcriptional regulator, MarR family-like protein [Ramlibacter sp.]